jgi:nicotinate-nucleotide adenylyltransferase
MLMAAVDGVDGLEVDRREIDRAGPTYTADTVDELRVAHPDAELFLILGADAAAEVHTWDRIDEVRRETTLVVVTRAGTRGSKLPDWRRLHRIEIPALEISSSDLRRRAAAGEPLDGLMPPAAIRCLRERDLYPGS